MKTNNWKGRITALVILPMMMVSCTDIYVHSITGHGDIVQSTLILDDFDGFINTVAADIYLTQGETQEEVVCTKIDNK